MYKNIKVVTKKPIAIDSPDHIVPTGTKNDNTTNISYIKEVENYFNKDKISVMDIGCAGGQLAVDFYKRGHFSIGLEGSDYNIKNNLHNWPKYYNKVLHTADLTTPYFITRSDTKIKFDIISAWEVVEHIHPKDLDAFFENMFSNLSSGGIFVGSINCGPDIRKNENGELVFLHQSVFPKEFWVEKILNKYEIKEYPFKNRVRVMDNYFCVMLRRKQ